MEPQRKIIGTILLLGIIFLMIPLIFLILASFNDADNVSNWGKFSLKWYEQVIHDEDIGLALIDSLKIACISASSATCIGLMGAISSSPSRNICIKTFIKRSSIASIVMPDILIGISLLMLFMSLNQIIGLNPEFGVLTVTIGHMIVSSAYIHIHIRSRLISLGSTFEESALDLGARRFTVFVKIKLPLISRALYTGWLLAFTLSLDDVVISSFLAGPGTTTLQILIFSNVRIGCTSNINALASLFVLVIMVLLIIIYKLLRRK